MILIGRGLDLKASEICWKREKFRESEGSGHGQATESARACAVLRVRIKAVATPKEEEVGRPIDGRSDGSRKAAATESKLSLVSGDNSLRDPPVPIPNTEVKPQHADSTWLETAR